MYFVSLHQMKTQAEKRLSIRLQMPPFMKERTPIKHILSVDPQLKGLDKSKYVFTDITFGVKDRVSAGLGKKWS